ncbi:hypothetical protein ACNF42_04090 [Cuniculiplasma sp. SKW3]|uniref:hypothetical protein n=1 Tax=Cuniculiplasma sp. SKW3 TaxID=3400170 RepID=UPI003FD39EAD
MTEEEYNRINEVRRTRFLLALPVLAILFSMIIAAIVLFTFNKRGYADAFPLFLVLLGIVVIFFGAFYDLGANKYIENVFIAKAPLKEHDVTQINREQLIMTLIYLGDGVPYIIAGVILNFVFTSF